MTISGNASASVIEYQYSGGVKIVTMPNDDTVATMKTTSTYVDAGAEVATDLACHLPAVAGARGRLPIGNLWTVGVVPVGHDGVRGGAGGPVPPGIGYDRIRLCAFVSARDRLVGGAAVAWARSRTGTMPWSEYS